MSPIYHCYIRLNQLEVLPPVSLDPYVADGLPRFSSLAILPTRWSCLWIISLLFSSQLFKMCASSSIDLPHLHRLTSRCVLSLVLLTLVGREQDRAWVAVILSPTFRPLFIQIQSRDVLLANVTTMKWPLFCHDRRSLHCLRTSFFALVVSFMFKGHNRTPLIWSILSPVNCHIGTVETFIFWLARFLDIIVVIRRSGILALCRWCSQSLDFQDGRCSIRFTAPRISLFNFRASSRPWSDRQS